MNKQQNTEYWERMTKYLSNELNNDEKLSFEHWANDVDNQELFNEMKSDIEKIDETKYIFEKSTDEAWAKLYSKIQQTETKPTRANYPFVKILYQVAAGLVILFGIGWGIMHLQKSSPFEILTTGFTQSKITLPDGSVVSLNANSSLTYPKSFAADSRKVELIGEAYFEITPNPDKPFIISANNAEIKVLGTKFNVLAPKDNKTVEVLVESGIVSLSPKNNLSNSILLEKGKFGILNTDNVAMEFLLTNPNYLSWKTKKMEFRNETLTNVLKVINHTYGTNIALASEPLKELKLTSKYDNINLDTLLQSICVAFNLKKSEINNQIILANNEK